MIEPDSVRLSFTGELWHWRGPAPYHFVTVAEDACDVLRLVASAVSYGWGVIPVRAWIGASDWETSLFPKAGTGASLFPAAPCRGRQIAEGCRSREGSISHTARPATPH